jgi:hypothetical protein
MGGIPCYKESTNRTDFDISDIDAVRGKIRDEF